MFRFSQKDEAKARMFEKSFDLAAAPALMADADVDLDVVEVPALPLIGSLKSANASFRVSIPLSFMALSDSQKSTYTFAFSMSEHSFSSCCSHIVPGFSMTTDQIPSNFSALSRRLVRFVDVDDVVEGASDCIWSSYGFRSTSRRELGDTSSD